MSPTSHTTCPMDCPDACTLDVTVEGEKVTAIHGSREHPLTDGFICSKVSRFAERVYHADRLLYPMKRSGPKGSGAFQRISWDAALTEITERLSAVQRHWGGEAILPYHYGGSNGLLTDEALDDEYFARLGASRLDKTICAAPTSAVASGMYGKMPGVAFADYVDARCIIIWGANPKVANIHLVPLLREARQRGAFVAVVDPTRNFSQHEVDLHLPVYPGTDLPVALSMIRHWQTGGRLDRRFLAEHATGSEAVLAAAEPWSFEKAAAEARVDPDDIRRLADVYADSQPAVIRCGWGVERNRNGGQAVAAILAMPALMGKFGVKGGGYTMSNSRAAVIEPTRWFKRTPWQTRTVNMTELGRVLTEPLEPPIKATFVYNCNPVATVPDQVRVIRGFERDDLFTVVFEQVMTDTARLADILLPATTFLEHYDVRRSYGNYVVGGVRPLIPACGEARSNLAVFAALGQAMGWHDEPFSWDEPTWVTRTADAIQMYGRKPSAEVWLKGESQGHDFPGPTPIQFDTVPPRTPDGKAQLTPRDLGPQPFSYTGLIDQQYPLALISPANSKMISSTLGEFNYDELVVTVNPEDAESRGIRDGTTVRVFNDQGVVVCRVRVSERVRPGVASMPKGAWRRSSRNGATSTALCPATLNVVGGGACFNDARVEIETVSSS